MELKSAEEKHSQNVIKLKLKYKEKIRFLEKELKNLTENNKFLEQKVSDQDANHGKVKTLLEKEIGFIRELNKELEKKTIENSENFSKTTQKKNEIISKLKEEIDLIKKENAEEISKLTEDTNKSILELKSIYDQEKPLRKSIESNDTYEKLKKEFEKMQEIIRNLESNEFKLKEELRYKGEYIEKIARTLRVKASEDPKTLETSNLLRQKESLSESLIDKEIEISKLKKQIGDLKLEITYGACKPPIHSPKGINRSMTFINKPDSPSPEPLFFEKQEELKQLKQYERMISHAASIECEYCCRVFATNDFSDHILSCRLDDSFGKSQSFIERNSLEKVQDLEKQVEILKLALGKLKNQRDKAKIESEKLLMQLKQVKLDWALSEESSDEKTMELKKELKNTIEILQRVRRCVTVSSDIGFEIDLSIQNTDRFFGGRLSKSFISSRLFNN